MAVNPDQRRFPLTTVKAVQGFFVRKERTDNDQAVAPSLFKNFEMVPPSWSAFQTQLTELESSGNHNVKVVYFVRHAQGFHNLAEETYGKNLWEEKMACSDEYLDPDLTPFGLEDAKNKGQPNVKAELEKGMPPIERVVVSPISRAIQTAQHFFAKDQVPDEPFVCIESCRETFDCHMCNKRQSLSVIKQKFPDVDFSRMKDEEDLLWSLTHTETKEEIQARARLFLLELFREVPERYVVVSAHLTIIEAICAVATGSTTRVLPGNCEVVPLVLEAI